MKIEEAVATRFRVIGSGRYLKTIEHDSLVIDTEKNTFYWNSRGFGGDVYKFLTSVANFRPELAAELATPVHEIMPTKSLPINQNLHKLCFTYGKNHREFWYNRGFTDDVIDLYLLGYLNEQYTIPFVMYGKLNALILRGKNKFISEVPGSNKSLFGLDQIVSNKLFLVESPLDVPILRLFGLDALSFTYGANAWDSNWNGILSNYEVTVIPDNDFAGKNLIKKLGFYCKVAQWPKSVPKGYDIGKLYLNNKEQFLSNLIYLDNQAIPVTFLQ